MLTDGKNVVIQDDNALPHGADTDSSVLEAAKAIGWSTSFARQPLKSPDLNVLDLGFFASLQALQLNRMCYTVDALIDAVGSVYREMQATTIDEVFVTLQAVMELIMLSRGSHLRIAPSRQGQDDQRARLSYSLAHLKLCRV